MATVLTINGTPKYVPPGGLRYRKEGASESMTATIQDTDSSASAYRPVRGDLVVLTEDGELAIGGPITKVTDRRIIDDVGTETTFEVSDWTHLLDSIHVFETYVEQGAYVTFAHVVDLYLTEPYGVTYIGTTTGGPTLPAMSFEGEPLRSVIEKLETMSGLFFRINGLKQASAGPKETSSYVLAPDGSGNTEVLFPSVEWEASRARLATRVYVQIGASGTAALARTEDHAGDGARTVYLLDAVLRASEVPATIAVHRGSVTVETLGVYPSDYATHEWTYAAHYPAQNARAEIIHNTALGSVLTGGQFIRVDLSLGFPITVRVEDEAAIDGGDIIERFYAHSDVATVEEGLALAAGYLRDQSADPTKAIVRTRQGHIYPNMEVGLEFPGRLLSGDWLVTATEGADIGIPWSESNAIVKTHTLVQGDHVGRTVLDFLRRVGRGGGSGGGGAVIGVGTPPGSGSGTVGYPVGHTQPLGGDNYNAYTATTTWQDWPHFPPTRHGGAGMAGDWLLRTPMYQMSAGTLEARLINQADSSVIASTSTTQTGTLTNQNWAFETDAYAAPSSVLDVILQFRVTSGSRKVKLGQATLVKTS